METIRSLGVSLLKAHGLRMNIMDSIEFSESSHKAFQLLLECLYPEQRETLMEYGCFLVKSRLGTFRIEYESGVNIILMNGWITYSFCIMPNEYGIPLADRILAQKLLLEAAPERFMKIAHRW